MTRTGAIARRVFLRHAGVGLTLPLGSVVGPVAAAEAPSRRSSPRLENLCRDDFTPRVGTTVRIERDSAPPLRARLVEARGFGAAARGPAPGRAPFSLIFEGPRGDRLTQETYRVAFGSLGTFAIFLVPIGPSGRVTRYEAVFA